MGRDAGVSGSPQSPASRSLCLDLDAISSGDSEVGAGSALRASPVAVILVHSSDSDPDSSDERSLSVSVFVVESPSHYTTPDEPVMLSATSSVLISPNRVLEDCVSVTLDAYPVFEVSPDTTGYVPATPPVPPPSPEVSFPPPAQASFLPGAPVSVDGMILAIPLLPLRGRYGACASVGSPE